MLNPWPSSGPAALEWRRVIKLRGRMAIELVAGDATIGRLVSTGAWGREYRAETEDAAWRFVARVSGATASGHTAQARGTREPPGPRERSSPRPSAPGSDAATFGSRTDPLLEWRQLRIQGRRYRLALPHDGPVLLIARNTGGSLRWRGTIELREPAHALGSALPLLVLFSTFLVFSSNELGS